MDDGDIRPAKPPSLSLTGLIAGALLWAIAMDASSLLGVYLRNRLETPHLSTILLIFFLGALPGWITAIILCQPALARLGKMAGLAAAFVVLCGSTIAWTAFAFAMQYRLFYAHWHDPLTTVRGLYQFSFTTVAAVYQFLVLGTPLYLPAGILCLAAASLLIARRKR
ncbi:hypothetical protein [Rhizobium sp. PAMB 3182]